jgi:hypothetical protein
MKKLLVFAAAALSASAAIAAGDNFNRSHLGRNWVKTHGSLYIANDQLQGGSGALGYDKNSGYDTAATVTVYLNGTDVEYGAVALGDVAGGNNAFVKIQSQDGDGKFEYGAFYVGNNGEGEFFALKEPASSPATISAWFCGTYGFLRIKSAAGAHKYYYNYGTYVATGAGLGTGGAISLDNYKSGSASCKNIEGATEIKASNARDFSLSR